MKKPHPINFNYQNITEGAKHLWLPYCQMANHLPQLPVIGAKGSKIYLADGTKIVDGIASWWAVAHGYQHPYIVKTAVKQLKQLSHIMLAGFANEATYKLAKNLCDFTNFDHVFFSDSGSTAIEVAMKIAWQYYINIKNYQKTKFISFKNSYHGDTTGAMSLADLTSGMHHKFSHLLLQHHNLAMPQSLNDLNQLADFIKKNQQEIAGIFLEPIVQCAGGMKFSNPIIIKEIADLAKKYHILLIADECATGFYRTGKKFAFHHCHIAPDILVVGKALSGGFTTIAGTLTTAEIFNSFKGEGLDLALMHGPTFMGNPLACSIANASLEIFNQNNYQEKILQDQQLLAKELKILEKHPKVKDVRVMGLIAVVEFHQISWDEILLFRTEAIKHNVFLRPFANVVYLMPPLVITKSELKQLTTAIKNIINQIFSKS